MNILAIFQFFSTGRTPDTVRPFKLCRMLASQGHNVTVLATDFNRHSGETEGPPVEIIPTSGRPMRILRLPSERNYRRGLRFRFLNYAGFSWRVLLKGLTFRHVDLVLTSIPPTFVGPAGWFIAKLRRVPFLLEVRDLWPDALQVKGAVKNQYFLKALYALSHFLYRQADFIVTMTYGIKEELINKGVKPQNIEVLPNGYDSELFTFAKSRETVRRLRGWNDDFVAIYIGTLVEVTSMDTIVEAAAHLTDMPRIRIEIFGAGSTETQLRTMIHTLGLKNCRLNGTVPKEEVPSLLMAADVCLMCLFETPLAHIYFQNKFFDYLGAGKPIAAAMRGHQRWILEKVGAGLCVDPKDSRSLAESIKYIATHMEGATEMGRRGREYAMKHFCLEKILDRYRSIIEAFDKGQRPQASHETLPPLP